MGKKYFLLNLVFITGIIFAQENEKRTFGISASFQGAHTDIQIPIWVSQSTVIAPVFGFGYVQGQGTDLILGVAPKFYLKESIVAPYISTEIALLLGSPEGGSPTLDIFAGIGFGGEYFFDKNFSVGAEAQLNFTKSDGKSLRFGNPDRFSISTGTSLFATIYF